MKWIEEGGKPESCYGKKLHTTSETPLPPPPRAASIAQLPSPVGTGKINLPGRSLGCLTFPETKFFSQPGTG